MLLNVGRVQAVLEDLRLDALVATTRENLVYAADYERTLLYSAGAPGAAIVTGRPARLAALVLPRIEAGYLAEREAHPDVLVFYGDFFVYRHPDRPLTGREVRAAHLMDVASIRAPSFLAGVLEAVKRLGLDRAAIGWDDIRIGQLLARELTALRAVEAPEAWRRIRAVKTAEEIERLRRCAAINEAIESYLIRLTAPGVEWRDIMEQWRLATTQAGAVPGFWSAAPGQESGFIYETMDHRLRPGDLVRYDFGCVYRHYWSDTGRTVAIGEPDPLTRRRYGALRAGLEEALAAVRPGVTYSRIFTLAMNTIARSGLPEYRRHHCGHSIGLQLYDGDYIAPTCDTALETGMVLNIEVPYYELGWGGLQIEDTIVVTPTGYEPLTTLGHHIFVA